MSYQLNLKTLIEQLLKDLKIKGNI